MTAEVIPLQSADYRLHPYLIPVKKRKLDTRLREIDTQSAEPNLSEEERAKLLAEVESIHSEFETLHRLEQEYTGIPVDLFGNLELPAFPVHLVPLPIATFAKDQAELIGVDAGIICISALVAAAACIDDRIQIQPKRKDPNWTESARLWAGVIGDPSTMKTPGLRKAMFPLYRIDERLRKETAIALAEWEQEVKSLGKDADHPPEPLRKRMIVNDVTVEKLGDILSKSEPRGIISAQDELSGWLASIDAYKNGAGGKDKAALLEAFNGGPKAIDRIGRGSLFVENWSLCVVGGIQPSVIQQYANNANHDGMLQRFILYHARESQLGKDTAPNMEAIHAYERLMNDLHTTKPPPSRVAVRLTEEAHQVREELERVVHGLVTSHPNRSFTAALGKYNGLYARLLLTYHCIECAGKSKYPTDALVSGETALQVFELIQKVILVHALKFYEGLDPAEDTSKEIANLLLARGWERFTAKADLVRNCAAIRKLYSKRPWDVENALDRLSAYSWIAPEPGKITAQGRPVAYLVNPEVHRLFKVHAKREIERREEVAKFLQDLKAKC